MKAVVLGQKPLTLESAQQIALGAEVKIWPTTRQRVQKARSVVERKLREGKPAYSLNTGLGFLANTPIAKAQVLKLQRNIIRSHAGGSGESLAIEETRLVLALRLNLLLKGFSGVRFDLCEALRKMLLAEIYPIIPSYGSVGASGDLIPLAHVGLGLIGEGKVRFKGKVVSAKQALRRAGLMPFELQAREGLACINGTEVMQAVGGLALVKALSLEKAALKIAALSVEAFQGQGSSFDARLHAARGQVGQVEVAQSLRKELEGSYIYGPGVQFSWLQDPYSLRCIPQIHGPAREALRYVQNIVERELNAVTDNPLLFTEANKIISGGNFHGQALALAYDFAAIACTQLAGVSERRLELLVNPNASGLPAFLVKEPGINSGYMALQYLSASVVNENKVLSHPASADSIPGNVGVEDYVSMGMTAARKFRKVVENLEVALAAELLAAAQAVDLRGVTKLGRGTRKTYKLLRDTVPTLKEDRVVAEDVERARLVVLQLV